MASPPDRSGRFDGFMSRATNSHTMGRDAAPTTEPAPDSEVMASIDDEGCDPRLVIADITADESWVSISAATAVRLADWQ